MADDCASFEAGYLPTREAGLQCSAPVGAQFFLLLLCVSKKGEEELTIFFGFCFGYSRALALGT